MSLRRRLKRLEGQQGAGFAVVVVDPSETTEEALARHMREHPEDRNAATRIKVPKRQDDVLLINTGVPRFNDSTGQIKLSAYSLH
jgi:hypothetical protein